MPQNRLKGGAYIVKEYGHAPKLILLASGSEVSTLIKAGVILLQEHGIATRVVSVPSEGLFRSQSKEYQQQVLPAGCLRIGLTAGLPVALESLVGEKGMVLGLDHFGYSANATVLDEKFGFTPQQVAQKIAFHVTMLTELTITQEA